MSIEFQKAPGVPGNGKLALSAIRIGGGTQSREKLSPKVVKDYMEALAEGATFPPVVVFHDGEVNWLADGFHRLDAHRQSGRKTIAADVRQGTQRDAILFSVGANETHVGLLYEQLTGDYSKVNDRTWRAAVTEFRRRVEGWQHHLMVFQFCRPVWRRWSILAKLSGSLSDAFDPLSPVKWTPQAWPYINPVQDVQARSDEVKAVFTSRTAVVSERGEDAAVIDEENAADNARADAKKLSYTSDGRTAAKGQTPAVRTGRNGGPPLDADEAGETNSQDEEDE